MSRIKWESYGAEQRAIGAAIVYAHPKGWRLVLGLVYGNLFVFVKRQAVPSRPLPSTSP